MNKLFITILLLLSIAACGGGSSDDSEDNQSPTANAGEDKTVDEGNGIILSGSATDSDGSISSYSWTQT